MKTDHVGVSPWIMFQTCLNSSAIYWVEEAYIPWESGTAGSCDAMTDTRPNWHPVGVASVLQSPFQEDAHDCQLTSTRNTATFFLSFSTSFLFLLPQAFPCIISKLGSLSFPLLCESDSQIVTFPSSLKPFTYCHCRWYSLCYYSTPMLTQAL